jgi:hypothetical protein
MSLGMGLILWLVLAVGVGASGLLTQLPMPAPQLILALLTAAVLIAIRAVARVRNRIEKLPLQTLVLFHATRFIGFYFLYLYSHGRLPYAFAVLGGRADIVVALSAIILVCVAPTTPVRRGFYLIWNAFGSLDILFVVFTAARIGLTEPAAMHELTVLPLSLLPTFLVPLIIVSHVLIFARLRAVRHEIKPKNASINPSSSVEALR